MSAIRVEKAASIGAQVLNDFEHCNRPLSDGLPRAVEAGHLHVRMEVHGYALPYKDERTNNRKRQQHPKDRPDEINPEVTQGFRAITRYPADECDTDRQARCARKKILDSQSDDLAEVTQRGFPSVSLPSGSGRKTHGSIHR